MKRILGCLFATAWLMAAQASDVKPNFIVINIDDMGYADIGPFGSKLNRTPNLDRMAQEGCKLTAYYAAPVCSPSRSALMTGCYPKRVLPIPGVLFPSSAVGLTLQQRTVAELLKAAGYVTGCVGKWHLGDQPEFLPTRRGFDFYLGIPYSNDMGPAADGSKSSLGEPLPPTRPGNPKENDESGLHGHSQPPLPLLENEKVKLRVKQAEQQGIVERYTTAAVKFIKEHRDQSFFLYLPHNAVHFPLYPGKQWAGKSPNGIYSDWVEEVDWSVGQMLAALRELKLDAKTLVIFTSDNGGTPRAVNAPLRGFKGSTFEGGMRVPTLAWWPGKIPAGTTCDAVTGMLDVLPTFAALAGAKIPDGNKVDGANIWPLLAGDPNTKPAHETFYYFHGLKLQAVRHGDWKLQLVGDPAPAKGKNKGKQAAGPAAPKLYNLKTDIGEASDVAAAHPDIVKQLQALAELQKNDLGLDGIGPGCRELGRVKDPQPLLGHDGKARKGFEYD
jgi:arylsulfatase A-like enzyme